MKINWNVRIKNPLFWGQVVLAILTPILGYLGLTAQDITSWPKLGEILLCAIQNPYVLTLVAVSVFNAVTDPTTKGVSDSSNALTYTKPN